MENSDNHHTRILNVFAAAAAKVSSRCQSNIQNTKVLVPPLTQSLLLHRDYVPEDMRPLDINLEVISLNIKLSVTIINIEYSCANDSRQEIFNNSSTETNAFRTSTTPVPTTRRHLFVTLLRLEIFNCRY